MSTAGRLPDFIVIGAMKGGSTTLFHLLAAHPRIFMCEPKEPGFFSRPERYARGLDWYAALFARARADQIAGEASTCYSRWPHFADVPALLARHVPNAKLVYLLRHPVERAYSHYRHEMEERAARQSAPLLTLAEALQEIPEILDASRYAMQIERYLAHFPRERLHVLTLDDLRAQAPETWRALQEFLGVGVIELPVAGVRVDNEYGTKTARGGIREWLRRLRSIPGWRAAKLLVPTSLRRDVRAWMLRPEVARRLQSKRVSEMRDRLSPLGERERAAMLAALDDSTRALERMLGRDLASWRR